MPHHKVPTVESSGASLSGAAGAPPSNRALVARAASASRLCTRTIVETAACPPELRHGDAPWQALLAGGGSFSDFRVQRMLGEGSMSSVVHCVCSRSGAHCAVKMYHRDRMNAMNVKQVGREIEIHASLLHPHILRLFAAFEDADGIYLVQEWASRGDLYVELSRRGGYMPEAHVVKHVMVPFLQALTYMHAQGILHRDIKPENIMLGGDGGVRVGDFGLAINTTREKPMSRVGTLDYMPPEIVRLPYGAAAAAAPRAPPPGADGNGAAYGLPVDAWCCGVLAFELLLGSPPFEADSKDATYTRILKLEPSLPSHLSDQARDFIRCALAKDPAQRPTVHQLLRHPWLRTHQRPQSMVVLEPKNLLPAAPPASPTPPGAGVAAATAVGTEHPASGAAEPAVAAANKQGGSKRSPGAPLSASAPAAPDSPSARPGHMSKSLSFNSAMAGRFSAVKPSKPSPLSLLLRSKAGSKSASQAASRGSGSSQATSRGSGSSEDRSRDTAALVAAAAVAEIEAEAAAATAASKAAISERLVVHVEAAAGAAATAALVAASATAPGAAGDDDLIPAGLPDGSTCVGGGGASRDSGGHAARGSLISQLKRKLSFSGGKGVSLFSPAGPAAGPDDEAAAVAAVAAAAAASMAAAGSSGVGTIAAVPMQQLLAGPKGGAQLKRSHSGRLHALALGFGRKLSLAGRRKSGAVPVAGADAQGRRHSRLATTATA